MVAIVACSCTYQPLSAPVNIDVVENWVQPAVDMIDLIFWEDHIAAVATMVESLQDCWYIVCYVALAGKHSAPGSSVVA